MNELLTNPLIASSVGTLSAIALAALLKMLHGFVTKTETKLDDKIYEAVTKAFEDNK